jgi:hypothetical protein
MIKSWNECSIDLFYAIDDVIKDTTLPTMTKNVKLISLILDIPENVIYSMPIEKYNEYIQSLQWANNFKFDKNYKPSKIVINGQKYKVITKTNDLSIGQYIDFQTFWMKKDIRKYIGNLLACFILPENKKYGEDYDISELAETIRQNLDIVTAYSLLFFSLKKYLDSTISSFIYLRKKLKTKEEKQEITKIIQTLLSGWSLSTPSQN